MCLWYATVTPPMRVNIKNAAAELASMRKVKQKKCAWCNKGFEALTVAKYCSNSCRQAAYRERREVKEAQNEN